jgi:hypothetical protein
MGYEMLDFIQKNFEYRDGFLFRTTCRGGEKIGNPAGWQTTCNGRPYIKLQIKGEVQYLHRAIFLLHHGYLPKVIDHIDGNSLNNKIENLRPATQSENMGNSRMKSNNTSGIKGVTFRKDTSKWAAAVMKDGKHISLGSYVTKEEAAVAYLEGAKRIFGEFAKADISNLQEVRATV